MASGSKTFSVHQVHDILDNSADFDDEPIMDGSDDEFEDISNPIEQSDSSIFTRTPSPLPLPSPISNSNPQNSPVNTHTPSPPSFSPISTPNLQQSTVSQLHSTPSSIPQVSTSQVSTSSVSQQTSVMWSSVLAPVPILPFIGNVGPTFTLSASPIEIFTHFVTEELMTTIVNQSNLYASQVMTAEQYEEWVKISIQDLKAYLGFYILMSLNHLPAIEDYWKVDPCFHYHPVADRISRSRFREITKFLHFADNTQLPKRGETNYDRLGKVRQIMTYFSKKFFEKYEPNCEQAIDEAMIPFQGRSSIKQYMPMKPVKRGFKVWVRADSHNGYFSEFSVYEGRSESALTLQDTLGARVVKSLSKNIVGKYHHLFIDNFFTSPSLVDDLLKDKIYVCGTVRVNRSRWPVEFKNKSKKYIKNKLQLKKR